jgi:hypothetical protein
MSLFTGDPIGDRKTFFWLCTETIEKARKALAQTEDQNFALLIGKVQRVSGATGDFYKAFFFSDISPLYRKLDGWSALQHTVQRAKEAEEATHDLDFTVYITEVAKYTARGTYDFRHFITRRDIAPIYDKILTWHAQKAGPQLILSDDLYL